MGSIPTALTNQLKDLSRDFRSRIEVTLVFGQQTGQQLRDFALAAGHVLYAEEDKTLVARAWEDFGAHACFVDDTGGFGAGWIDGLKQTWSMAFECVQWIRRGGALPESANLLTALTQTTYTFQGDKLLLEPRRTSRSASASRPTSSTP